jgi:hypothetical protein
MLRKVVEPPPGILNDEELLKRILDEVRAIKAQKGDAPRAQAKVEVTAALKPTKKAVKKQEAA